MEGARSEHERVDAVGPTASPQQLSTVVGPQGYPVSGLRSFGHIRALHGSIGNRAVGRLLRERVGIQRPGGRVPVRRLARVKERLVVSGNQFGETYHIALAMIMAKLDGSRIILPEWLTAQTAQGGRTPSGAAQKAFLAKVFRWLNAHSLAEVEAIGRIDPGDERLSHNVASGVVGDLVSRAGAWSGLEVLTHLGYQVGDRPAAKVKTAMVFLRRVFLSAPDLNQLITAQDQLLQTREAQIAAHIHQVLDQLLDVANRPGSTLRKQREARQYYVIFNRQQADGPERNLTQEIVECIREHARARNVRHFLVVTRQQDAFPVQIDGTTFINIGPAVMTQHLPAGCDSYTYQLNFFWALHKEYRVMRHVGMKSGAMDGPAMLGIPTLYFDTTHTARLESVKSHLGLKRVDISDLGHRPPHGMATDVWRARVRAKLWEAEQQ